VEVESIVGFCPAIAFLGFVLALVSLQNGSLNLLLFGLSCPIATSMVALLISSLSWSPPQATIPVRVMLTLNAGVTVVWGAWTARQIIRSCPLDASAGKWTFRFSLLALLGLITLMCILLALLRQLAGSGEMVWFAVYGIGVLVISFAVFIWFWYRVKRGIREATNKRHTAINDMSVRYPTRHGRRAESPLV
jgi:hypothetical protein